MIDPVIGQLIADVAEVKGKTNLLIVLVSGTLLPIWVGALTNLWKASKIVKFLGGGR